MPLTDQRAPTGAAPAPLAPRAAPLRRDALVRLYAAASAVILAVALLADVKLIPGWVVPQGIYVVSTLLMILGVAAAVRAGAGRLAWGLLLAGSIAVATADALFIWETRIAGGDGLLGIADPFYLVGYAGWIAGLAVLDRPAASAPRDRAPLLDALIVTGALAAVFAVLQLRPDGIASGTTLEVAVNLAYPIAGFTILWLLLVDAYRYGLPLERWRILLASGFALFGLLTTLWLFTLIDPNAPWCLATLLIGAGGLAVSRGPAHAPVAAHPPHWMSESVPITALAVFAIVAIVALADGTADPWTVLISMVAVGAAIVARLLVTVRQNRRLLAEGARREAEFQLAREAAERADRAKSAFLATMSHELRTPLSAIIGSAELLEDGELTEPERRRLLHAIATAGDALLAVVSDVLDFSKIEAGRFTLERVPFDPREVVASAVDVLAGAAEVKGLLLEATVGSEVPARVVGDPGRLRQILLNLLSNAVKFTVSGEVRATCRAEAGDERCVLELAVSDTGPGISPEAQRRLFIPFEQDAAQVARRRDGTGLGLAISRRLAELMGGTLTVESQLGEGATFRCRIPATLAPAAAPGQTGPSRRAARRARRRRAA